MSIIGVQLLHTDYPLRDAMFKKRISLLKKKIILGLKKEVIVKYNHPA